MESSVRVNWWSRLRTRMGLSYVIVTLFIVLLLEAILVAVGVYLLTRSPLLGYLSLERAGQAAQVLALQAALHADDEQLSAQSSFEPGADVALSVEHESSSAQLSYFHLAIPYIEPGDPAPDRPTFALLVGSDEEVVASSYPDRFPAAADVGDLLPEELELIRSALADRPDGALRMEADGMHVVNAYPVRSERGQPLGAVLVRAPAGVTPAGSGLGEYAVLVPSGILWLCLMLPIGLLFGVLTTRGMIRRIERLVQATARFTEGDFSQRVPVQKSDEIGQLEGQFNIMAEQLVESVARRAAIAEESARREERARIEQEMSSARYVQKSLLPKEMPSLDGWRIEPFYDPAREVGGDLYDFVPLPDGNLGIVIGDVSGKGMPAALMMATTCAMMRAAARKGSSPGQVLGQVNDLLQDYVSPTTFVTCFYAILDPVNSVMCFANAGHDIPYLSGNGGIVELRARGMPLGLMPGQTYEESEVTIDQNSTILFYTDGLVEAHNGQREMFSFPRLQRILSEHSGAEDLIALLLQELRDFTGSIWEQEDDITLVILRKIK